ncbi:MAG: TM0106 family RecB-like putative nuclease [Armatimonadetes bacterium]|nr:MAG: TM0106 family RecB-like putative nuclease [Armatimonadota bacterium]
MTTRHGTKVTATSHHQHEHDSRQPGSIGGGEVGLCLTRIHHSRYTAATPVVDPVRQRRAEIGVDHERTVADALMEIHEGDIERISATGAGAYRDTETALANGAGVILGGKVASPDGTLVGAPDILVRMPTGYAAVEVKAHLVLGTSGTPAWITPLDALAAIDFSIDIPDEAQGSFRPNRRRDLYQVAHYWRILDALGYAADHPVGGVIGAEEPFTCAWVDLDNGKQSILNTTIDQANQALEAVRHGSDHPDTPLVAPWWRGECNTCEWMPLCHEALVAADDPTLLNHVSDETRTDLVLSGITSISQIASLEPTDERLAEPSVVLQARAWTHGGLLRRPGTPTPIDVSNPRRQVDFDIETYLGRIYLAGFLVTENGESVFDPVVDWEGTETSEADFVARLFDRLASYGDDDTCVFYWTSYEPTVLGAAGERFDLTVPGFDTVQDWFDTCSLDLHRWTKNRFVSPSGYGLKTIAPLCGFDWRDDDPGGQQSEIWFEEMRAGDASMKQRLLDYNEDDVAAQLAIRSWVLSRDDGSGPGSTVPSAADWPQHTHSGPTDCAAESF